MRRWSLIIVLGLLGALTLAARSSDALARSSLVAGLMDPLLGLDHLLALLLVGMWAGRLRDAALWSLPAAFLTGTVPGFLLAANLASIPLVEDLVHLLIMASLLLLVVAVLLPVRLSVREAASALALIGGCHGYIHGVEVGSGPALGFGLGAMASATALLASGVAVGLASPRAD